MNRKQSTLGKKVKGLVTFKLWVYVVNTGPVFGKSNFFPKSVQCTRTNGKFLDLLHID